MTKSKDEKHSKDFLNENNRSQKDWNKHIEYLMSSDTKYAIIHLLGIYDMLNLKLLAKLIGKSQSTIHKHLEDLMEKQFIQIANTMKGKYYELNDFIKELSEIEKSNENQEELELELKTLHNSTDEEFIMGVINNFGDKSKGLSETLALNLKQIMENMVSTSKIVSYASIAEMSETYSHIYIVYLIKLLQQENLDAFYQKLKIVEESGSLGQNYHQYLEKSNKEIRQMNQEELIDFCIYGLADKKYRDMILNLIQDKFDIDNIRKNLPIGSLNQVTHSLKISSVKQLAKIVQAYYEFSKKIESLQAEFDTENKEISPDLLTTQIINIFMGPLSKSLE